MGKLLFSLVEDLKRELVIYIFFIELFFWDLLFMFFCRRIKPLSFVLSLFWT